MLHMLSLQVMIMAVAFVVPLAPPFARLSRRFETRLASTREDPVKRSLEFYRGFRRQSRQVFIPQSEPLIVEMLPPRRRYSSARVMLNQTMLENSPANYESLTWLERSSMPPWTLELLCEISTSSPAYLSVIKNQKTMHDELFITDFSLTRRSGGLTRMCTSTGSLQRFKTRFPWPNEVGHVPVSESADLKRSAVLVTDGFLVPGRSNGGVYVLLNPGRSAPPQQERKVRLSPFDHSSSWYYHRAIFIDLTGDGRQSILTARARAPSLTASKAGSGSIGELVWLERPKAPRRCEITGVGLEEDGSVFDAFR